MDASAKYFYFYETGLFYKESVFLFLFVFTCSVCERTRDIFHILQVGLSFYLQVQPNLITIGKSV